MFKVNNERQLSDLLKLISEEAVKYTKQQLREGDDPFDSYYSGLKDAEDNIFEQEDTTAGEEEASQGPEDAQKSEPQQAKKPSDENFVASKDRLVDFVNDIRSAPSLKDSAVDEQVSNYYDRLSQEERDVLVFFLRELSRVMTGKASGSDARDPSEPPLNISFVSKEKDATSGRDSNPTPSPSAQPSASPNTQSQSPESDQEDTSPPIKVNESQDHKMIRRKIRSLFER